MSHTVQRYVAGFDLHFPAVHWPTFNCMMSFVRQNEIDGFVFGGDQFDNACISHHTRGKPALRSKTAYLRDETGFEKKILTPLEAALTDAEKIWIVGNHDDWERQLTEEQPELDGVIERPVRLRLAERNWDVIECGRAFKKGHLTYIHGDVLSGYGNQASAMHARKAVETFCTNVLYGHMHAPQSFTRVLPHNHTQKWMAHCAPILGHTNPHYLRNRPTAWLNGFVIIEYHGKSGCFNLFTVIPWNGEFAYGGKVYSHKDK